MGMKKFKPGERKTFENENAQVSARSNNEKGFSLTEIVVGVSHPCTRSGTTQSSEENISGITLNQAEILFKFRFSPIPQPFPRA